MLTLAVVVKVFRDVTERSLGSRPVLSPSRAVAGLTPRADMPLRLLGAWHLVCVVVAVVTLLPVLPSVIRHPAGWLTLWLVAVTALVGVALCVGRRSVLGTAAVLHGAQVLAWSVPSAAVWIVRLGPRVSLSVPPMEGHGVMHLGADATVFTIWGDAARLPLGVSVNVCALLAFVLCLSCLPSRAGQFRVDSA